MKHLLRFVAFGFLLCGSFAFAISSDLVYENGHAHLAKTYPQPENSCALNAVIIYRHEMEDIYEAKSKHGCLANQDYLLRAREAARPASLDRFVPAYDEFLKAGNLNIIKVSAATVPAEKKCHRLALAIRFLDHLQSYAEQPQADEAKIISIVEQLAQQNDFGDHEKGFNPESAKIWLGRQDRCPKDRSRHPEAPHGAGKRVS